MGIGETEGMKNLQVNQEQLNGVIEDLDKHLNNVLRKQEYEYLQAYNIYVKRKEKELRSLIDALDEKNSNNNNKELRIQQHEITIQKMRKDQFAYEQQLEQLKKEKKEWIQKYNIKEEEKEFFHKQALDAKRKNKLLKVAIGRLHVEREDIKKMAAIEVGNNSQDEQDTDTFLTGTNIEQKKPHYDNFENSQALVEQNIINSQQQKRGVTQSM